MTMGWTSNKEESLAVMDYALAQGFNFIDTADIYSNWAEGNSGGVAESWIGEWLTSRQVRDQVIIATKARGRMWAGKDGEGLSRAHLLRAVDDSLRRLQVEVIDLYQAHWPDQETPLEETLRAFEEMIKQGKVRYVGCSNYSSDQLKEALNVAATQHLPRYESLQPHYNLVHRHEYEDELMAICAEENLGVIPYSPLEGGFLTGKYKPNGAPSHSRGHGSNRMAPYANAEGFAIVEALTELAQRHGTKPGAMALAWLLANPTVTSAIVGASRVEQLADTLQAVNIKLSSEEKARLDELPSPK
jgi:aryl-alcohol dehydrogenase-like predicted oxidoreductase